MPILSLTALHLAAEGHLMTFFFWPFSSLDAFEGLEEVPAWIGLSSSSQSSPMRVSSNVLKNMQSLAIPALADELLDLEVCNLADELLDLEVCNLAVSCS